MCFGFCDGRDGRATQRLGTLNVHDSLKLVNKFSIGQMASQRRDRDGTGFPGPWQFSGWG